MNRVVKFVRYFLLICLVAVLIGCGGSDNAPPVPSISEDSSLGGDPAAGQVQYDSLCIACHGPNGEGMEGLGKPFTTSDFIQTSSDLELLTFIKVGRPVGDPANTTGVDMPPKGGNPALADDEIIDIIAYIRTLQP